MLDAPLHVNAQARMIWRTRSAACCAFNHSAGALLGTYLATLILKLAPERLGRLREQISPTSPVSPIYFSWGLKQSCQLSHGSELMQVLNRLNHFVCPSGCEGFVRTTMELIGDLIKAA